VGFLNSKEYPHAKTSGFNKFLLINLPVNDVWTDDCMIKCLTYTARD